MSDLVHPPKILGTHRGYKDAPTHEHNSFKMAIGKGFMLFHVISWRQNFKQNGKIEVYISIERTRENP